MNETRTIEVRLPADKEYSDDDLHLLRTACEALVGLSCGCEADPPAQVKAMAEEGWKVRTGLTWIARAERGREYEEAVGESRGESLCKLCQMTGLRSVDGCP